MNLALAENSATADSLTADSLALSVRIQNALRLVTAPFPYLAGLVAATRLQLDARVPTMGVFASGRLVANPQFVERLNERDLIFVLAHEMLHLALRTHERARGSDRLEFNFAHDYIINDIVRAELGVATIPAGGLDMPGARNRSAEELVLDLRRRAARRDGRRAVWQSGAIAAGRSTGRAPRPGGGAGILSDEPGDVLDEAQERQLFPIDRDAQKAQADRIKELAAKGVALARVMGALKGVRGFDSGDESQLITGMRRPARSLWEGILQRWLEAAAMGERTFSRPSRRAVAGTDVILPGRRRDDWILNVVLDTSGSMAETLPRVLGALADYCEGIGVARVRLVQCDTAVTADELLEPRDLEQHRIHGFGGSDLSPALLHLAADPMVRATLVVTDGDIEYPREPMPYSLLWLLPPGSLTRFSPPYGQVALMAER
jgi:predicted metal-dependent peptidase